MAAAGGLRYVVIRLQPKRRAAEIAMLAHELQHAVEIADTPSIVDEASLAREYARIGYRSRSAHGLAFDTKAAVEIGRRVAEELMTAEPIVGRALPGAPGGPDKVRPTD
jgi:predicted ATPase